MRALVKASIAALILTSLCTPVEAGLLTKGKLIILLPLRIAKHAAAGVFNGTNLAVYETMVEWELDAGPPSWYVIKAAPTEKKPAAKVDSLTVTDL